LQILVRFEITPKAFANFSPGVGACDNPGTHETKEFALLRQKPRVEATLR
jgi:hypothetical protein